MRFYIPSTGKPFQSNLGQYIFGRTNAGFKVIRLINYPELKETALLTDPYSNSRRIAKIESGEWIEIKLDKEVTITQQ